MGSSTIVEVGLDVENRNRSKTDRPECRGNSHQIFVDSLVGLVA